MAFVKYLPISGADSNNKCTFLGMKLYILISLLLKYKRNANLRCDYCYYYKISDIHYYEFNVLPFCLLGNNNVHSKPLISLNIYFEFQMSYRITYATGNCNP